MIQRAFSQLGFLVFTVVATIVLAEIGARVLMPEWAPVGGDRGYWSYDPDLGWSLTPNASGRLEYVDFSVDVKINADGLRDREYPVERVPGKRRMLVLGDSFTWGYGVEQEEVFAEVIEKSYPNWEIINAGVSGYGTDQQYLYYKLRGSKYRPDVVLLLFYNNDLENSTNAVQYYHNKPLFVADGDGIRVTNTPVPPETPSQAVANFIARNTYFLRIAAQVAARWRSTGQFTAVAAPNDPAPAAHETGALPGDQELVLRLLLALNDAVRADGARLIVVSFLSMPRPYELFSDPRLAEAGIDYFPLIGVFQDSSVPVLFEHDLHWTPHGHRLVAAAVGQHLEQIGVFSGRAGRSAERRARRSR